MKARYREMSDEELRDEENQLRTDLFNLRLGNTTKELEDTSKIPGARRALARVLTVLRERDLKASSQAGGE